MRVRSVPVVQGRSRRLPGADDVQRLAGEVAWARSSATSRTTAAPSVMGEQSNSRSGQATIGFAASSWRKSISFCQVGSGLPFLRAASDPALHPRGDRPELRLGVQTAVLVILDRDVHQVFRGHAVLRHVGRGHRGVEAGEGEAGGDLVLRVTRRASVSVTSAVGSRVMRSTPPTRTTSPCPTRSP
jgi:hypothetical protein